MLQEYRFIYRGEESTYSLDLVDKLNAHPDVKTYGAIVDPATFCPMDVVLIDDSEVELIEELLANGFVIDPEYKQSTN
jgi:hypothetical protein